MKKSNLFKSVLITLVALMLPLQTLAYDFMVDGLCYNINNDGNSVTVTYKNSELPRYSNLTGNLVIPQSVTYSGKNYSVTKISSSAFEGCNDITSVSIGNSVTEIGDWAFKDCRGLTSIIIPNSVTSIGQYCFEYCYGLTNVSIGTSVIDISYTAFNSCRNITSVEWNAKNCNGLTSSPFISSSRAIKSFTFGSQVENIPAYLCKGMTSITNIIIPNSVTSIGDYSFEYCTGLKQVNIGTSVTTIGDTPFEGCTSLTTVNWNAKNCSDFTAPSTSQPFYGLTNIQSIKFGNEVESVPAYICYNISGVKSLSFSNSVKRIGRDAFFGCNGLTSVTIGNSVTDIGGWAFKLCGKLKSIAIPNTVASIGEEAFNSSNLERILSHIENVASVVLGENVFRDVNKNTCQLIVPAGKVNYYKAAAQWKDFISITDVSYNADGYELTSESSVTGTAHRAVPITFGLTNADEVQKIEFDVSTSTWLNATGIVHEYDHSESESGEPWLDCYSFDFYNDFPYFFTVTERVTNIYEEDWRYLFGYSDLCEHANILNGVVSECGFSGHVVFHTSYGNDVFSDYIAPGNGALFSMNLLYPLKSGEHSLDVSNIMVTLVDGTEIALDPFTINITAEPIPGDVNDDGVLDKNDLLAGSSVKMAANSGNLVDGLINTTTLISVKIENDFAISSFSLKVKLPERIELVDDINSFLTAGERGESFSFIATQNADGTITIVGTSTTPLEAGQGAVLNLNVKTSWQNTYQIPLTEMKVTTPEGVVVSLPDSETKLIMQGTRGDMNGDGRVDLSDALYIINLATGLAE